MDRYSQNGGYFFDHEIQTQPFLRFVDLWNLIVGRFKFVLLVISIVCSILAICFGSKSAFTNEEFTTETFEYPYVESFEENFDPSGGTFEGFNYDGSYQEMYEARLNAALEPGLA